MEVEPDLTGSFIGPYEFVRPLGSGSFATVWLAKHPTIDTYVAIKVISKANLDSEEAVTRFTREVNLMKQMDQPFIAELFEVLDNENNYYLVMEYAPHGNMLDFINRAGRLSEESARFYFSQLVSALDYLHNSKKVAHRDLKAENILLDEHDNIRLIDFGLSNFFSRNQPLLKTACGSPAYAAPEMIQGQAYTCAADIYSAGVLLYAMVAGRLPFDDDDVQQLLQKVVYTEVTYPSFITRPLVDLLKRMLVKRPGPRISLAKIREHAWFSESRYNLLLEYRFQDQGKWVVWGKEGIDREIVVHLTGCGVDCKNLAEHLLMGDYSGPAALYRILRKDKITDRMKELLGALQRMEPPERYVNVKTPFPESAFGIGARGLLHHPQGPQLPGATVKTKVFQRRMSRPVVSRRPPVVLDMPISEINMQSVSQRTTPMTSTTQSLEALPNET